MTTPGRAILIGAGPGDPELMTLKAVRALGEADVVLVDELVDRRCLAYARPDARILRVGKRAGCRSTPQAFIQRLLVRYARQGKRAARLKGGDPFVFGRGGEEFRALVAAGVEVEVIPGVTAGIAAPAALGIPLTHRELARGVTFVTGHTKDGAEPDWKALAAAGTTLVVYMGLAKAGRIAGALMSAGMDPSTPACIVENATLPIQRHQVTTLQRLSPAGFCGPALIVIGEVVGLARQAKAGREERAA